MLVRPWSSRKHRPLTLRISSLSINNLSSYGGNQSRGYQNNNKIQTRLANVQLTRSHIPGSHAEIKRKVPKLFPKLPPSWRKYLLPRFSSYLSRLWQVKPFSSLCQSKGKRERRSAHNSTVNKVSENESTDDDEVYTLSLSTKTQKDQPLFKIKVQDAPITVMADSGASINILDEKEYHKLPNRPSLEPSRVKIYGYQSKDPLHVLGKIRTMLE